MTTQGLTKDDYRNFRDLLIKANETQLTGMLIALQHEKRKRYETAIAVSMGRPYGNQYNGYRLPSGKRVNVL